MSNNYFWSPIEKKTLQEAYKSGGLREAEKQLPDIRRGTIATQASRLQLTKPRPRKPK